VNQTAARSARATQQTLSTNYRNIKCLNNTEHSMKTPQPKATNINIKATGRSKPRGRTERLKIIHQAGANNFSMTPLFLFLHLSDFSFGMSVREPTFLVLPLIVVPIRSQEIALPLPGIATSKLLSMRQISFAKRASGYVSAGMEWA
jgi:hypothetical protein